MNKANKLYLAAIALCAIIYGANVHAAIRCQGQLIGPGDSEYALVSACGEPVYKHQIGSGSHGEGDEAYWYYKIDGQTVEIHMIDGHVYSVDGSIH